MAYNRMKSSPNRDSDRAYLNFQREVSLCAEWNDRGVQTLIPIRLGSGNVVFHLQDNVSLGFVGDESHKQLVGVITYRLRKWRPHCMNQPHHMITHLQKSN